MNCEICFFIGATIKIANLVNWCTIPVSLCQSNDLQLEIQMRFSYLKNVAVDFVLMVLKLYSKQVVILLPLLIKLTMGQLLLFFLCNFSSFLSYVGAVQVTNLFPLLLIDRYILAIQQIITHEEHLRYSFDQQQSSELPQKPWHYGHNNRKQLIQSQSYFYLTIPHKSHHFWLF